MNKTPLIILSTYSSTTYLKKRPADLLVVIFHGRCSNGHRRIVATEEASVGATSKHNEKYVGAYVTSSV